MSKNTMRAVVAVAVILTAMMVLFTQYLARG